MYDEFPFQVLECMFKTLEHAFRDTECTFQDTERNFKRESAKGDRGISKIWQTNQLRLLFCDNPLHAEFRKLKIDNVIHLSR